MYPIWIDLPWTVCSFSLLTPWIYLSGVFNQKLNSPLLDKLTVTVTEPRSGVLHCLGVFGARWDQEMTPWLQAGQQWTPAGVVRMAGLLRWINPTELLLSWWPFRKEELYSLHRPNYVTGLKTDDPQSYLSSLWLFQIIFMFCGFLQLLLHFS